MPANIRTTADANTDLHALRDEILPAIEQWVKAHPEAKLIMRWHDKVDATDDRPAGLYATFSVPSKAVPIRGSVTRPLNTSKSAS